MAKTSWSELQLQLTAVLQHLQAGGDRRTPFGDRLPQLLQSAHALFCSGTQPAPSELSTLLRCAGHACSGGWPQIFLTCLP